MSLKRGYIALLILIVVSCEDQNRKKPENEVTLKFWHSLVSSSIPALDTLLAKFEKENPGIKISPQYIPSGNAMLYKLVTAVQSGNTPDVSWIYAGSYKDLVAADAIFPMSRFFNGAEGYSEEELDDFFPGLWPIASWRDTIYSLPMEATNFGLIYNKKMFAEAGLNPEEPPKNWEEFYEFSKKLCLDKNGDGRFERVGALLPVYPASGPLGGYMVWQWVPFLWQAGGHVISKDQTQVLFASQAGAEALDFWKKMYMDLQLDKFSADHNIAFTSGLTAMVFDGPWSLGQYEEVMNRGDWASAPLPEGPVRKATNIGGEFLVIFKDTQFPDEAWKFVKWVAEPENQALWSMKSGYLPVRKSALEIEEYRKFLEANPNLKVFVEQMNYALSQRPNDFHSMQVDRYLAEAIEKATIGGWGPEKALAEAAALSNQALKENEK